MKKLSALVCIITTMVTSHLTAMDQCPRDAHLDFRSSLRYVLENSKLKDINQDFLSNIQRIIERKSNIPSADLSVSLNTALHQLNCDITNQDKYFNSLLHWSCRQDDLKSTEIILGAADNQEQRDTLLMMQNSSGQTALHVAICCGSCQVVPILLKAISKSNLRNFIDCKDNPGRNACEERYINGCSHDRLTLTDFYQAGFNGRTALYYAKFFGKSEGIKMLEYPLMYM